MKAMRLFTGLITFLFVAKMALASSAQPIEGSYIVELEDGVQSFAALSVLHSLGETENLNLSFGDYYLVKGISKENLKKLQSLPAIKSIEQDFVISLDNTVETSSTFSFDDYEPVDPRFESQWGLTNDGFFGAPNGDTPTGLQGFDINALEAWKNEKGRKDVVVAVIDTGVNYEHEDLKANMWVNEAELNGQSGVDDDGNGYVDDIHGYDFRNDDGDPMDKNGHGTHCAGIIGAVHNDIGVSGVMRDVSMMGLQFLSRWGSGSFSDSIRAVDYAVENGADVISASWGGGRAPNTLKKAIERAHEKGVIFVAAAGNSSNDVAQKPLFPAAFDTPNMVSVAATNHRGELASFSNYGDEEVHVAAPGRDILSTYKDNYRMLSGTSMATPHVSGVVGLLISSLGRMDPTTIRERLIKTSMPYEMISDKSISGGQVDAFRFLFDLRN